jgi:PAS domain S-box-containing protein
MDKQQKYEVSEQRAEELQFKTPEELVQKYKVKLRQANKLLQREIEKRKETERKLIIEKNLVHDVFNGLPCITYILDETSRMFMMNEAFEKVFGYSAKELSKMKALDFFPEEDKALVMSRINDVFTNQQASYVEASILTKTGQKIPFYLTGSLMRIDNTPFLVGTGIDIANLKKTERALRVIEERLSGILRSITDVMIIINESYDITWANEAANEFFISNVIGKKCYDIFTSNSMHCNPCIGSLCLNDGECHQSEKEIVGSDGKRIDSWCTTSVMERHTNGRPKLVLEVFRNITEKKAFEAESVRLGQLASLGELAAGVAHEINNPINGIINYSQILIDESQNKDISYKILVEANRIATIIKNLLSFSRDDEEEYRPVSLADIIDSTLSLFERQLLKDGINIKVNISKDLPKIRARVNQLQQVFLNILSNSRYALNKKFLSPHTNKIIKIYADIINSDNNNYIRTTFHDNGLGISEKIIYKICDPFFSTKPRGEGTGLGLHISYGIIKNHGGKLIFHSVEGSYTEAMVYIPTHEPNPRKDSKN